MDRETLSPSEKRALLKQLLAEKQGEKSVYPLSFAQKRLWLLEQIEPGRATFIMPLRYDLDGQLDQSALEASFKRLIARHESLRTSFSLEDRDPVQIVHPEAPFHLIFRDLSNLPSQSIEKELSSIQKGFFREPFELTRPGLLRALLIRRGIKQHTLLLAMHHIISDGWSNGIFFRELAILYKALLEGYDPILPDLKVSYGQVTRRQIAWAKTADFTGQLEAWKRELNGAPATLRLPTDRQRPSSPDGTGDVHQFVIPKNLHQQLSDLASGKKVTLYILLLAAFKVFLFKYSGQDDLVVGTPIAGRTEGDLENLIGFFLNTLAIRTIVDPRESFAELLENVRRWVLKAYDRQAVPVENIIDILDLDRDLRQNALFQVLFSLQNQPRTDFKLPDLTVSQQPAHTGTAKLDLSLYFTEETFGLVGLVEYSCELFDRETIIRMMGHLENILRQVSANPEIRISDIQIESRESGRSLQAWNQTERTFPDGPGLLERFLQLSKAQPDDIAFLQEDTAVTFLQLAEMAGRFAGMLESVGVKPGDIVGVSVRRSPEMVAALLAVLARGAAFLPLDPDFPEERLAFMAADARISAAILDASSPLQFDSSTPVLRLEPLLQAPALPLTPALVHPESPAYLIYTSGSTGRPKGVVVPHKQITNRLLWMWEEYPFSDGDVGCQRTALNFVDSIWEIFGYLLQGLPTVIIPDETVRNPSALVDSLARHQVTHIWLVPALLRLLLDLVPDLGERLPLLRFWVLSGEAFPQELFRRFYRSLPEATAYNLYGTSEVWDATWFSPEDGLPTTENVPIGSPIANTSAHILDPFWNPLPVGVPGQLAIGGTGLAHGYLGQPALTSERFIPDMFSENGGRLYLTGDRAKRLPDGSIEFLGRLDFQIKVRGNRVEPAEIEDALTALHSVRSAAVTLKAGRLAAFLIPENPSSPPPHTELRTALQRKLPDFMLPESYTLLENLPLTPSGKVDRLALPDPDVQGNDTDYTPPVNQVEKTLADLFEEVLEVQGVGTEQNFFELGGHSMLAIRLFARMEQVFHVRLPLSVLFQSSTVRTLAQEIIDENTAAWGSLVPIQTGGDRLPLFVIHPFGGHIFGYYSLARHLGPEFPLYGLKAQGWDDSAEPLTSVAEMAEAYIEEIRAVQPQGPYFLAGYSFGGHIAYEMARQLKARGDEVGLVALLDTQLLWVPGFHRALNRREYFRYRSRFAFGKLLHRGWHLAQKPWEEKWPYFKKCLRWRGHPEPEYGQLYERHVGNREKEAGENRIRKANEIAKDCHQLERYPGKLLLFKGNLTGKYVHYGWEELAEKGVESHDVDGHHFNIHEEPAVIEIARILRGKIPVAFEHLTDSKNGGKDPIGKVMARRPALDKQQKGRK